MKLALLLSGKLGFLALDSLSNKHEIIAVFTDKSSLDIINFTDSLNIPCFIGNPRKGRATSFILDKRIDILLSINYLFIIEKDLIDWPEKFAINFHGSLLPKYRGRTPHVWAIINNETKTGVTAHLIEEACDEGAIVKQREIQISQIDTGASILEKYAKIYPELINEVIIDIENNDLHENKQDEEKATVFEKRTPADGEIDWSWQKERIRNWIRAQTKPYPGAYTRLKGERVTIDEVEFDDFGFKQSMENGLILSSQPLRVKTSNGVIRITSIRNNVFEARKGDKFHSNEDR